MAPKILRPERTHIPQGYVDAIGVSDSEFKIKSHRIPPPTESASAKSEKRAASAPGARRQQRA
jgi:hypothetical protein